MAIKILRNMLFMILGFLALAIGIIGIVIPVLPGMPFLLIAAFCFTRSSKRIEKWFKQTTIYKKYVKAFIYNKGMTRKEKIRINLIADSFIVISIISIDILYVKLLLISLALYKHYYFIFKIKTIKSTAK